MADNGVPSILGKAYPQGIVKLRSWLYNKNKSKYAKASLWVVLHYLYLYNYISVPECYFARLPLPSKKWLWDPDVSISQ